MTTLMDVSKESGAIYGQLTQAASAAFGNLYLGLLRNPVALARAQADLAQRHTELWQTLLKPEPRVPLRSRHRNPAIAASGTNSSTGADTRPSPPRR